jgi:hypothetical protein
MHERHVPGTFGMKTSRILAALVMGLSLASPLSAADRPPNVIFILTDDQG